MGALNFPAVITRPDIAFGVSKLSEYLQNPSQTHIDAANHMLYYCASTKYLGIKYDNSGIEPTPLEVFQTYSDASFASDLNTRVSNTGIAAKLWNGVFLWKAIKQKSVTTSSTEAELVAMGITGKELLWIMRLFQALTLDLDHKAKIYCDNQQTLRLLLKESPKLETKLKHIDIQQHWLRQEVQRGNIAVDWIPTDQMVADGFTKSLTSQQHAKFIAQLGMVDVQIEGLNC